MSFERFDYLLQIVKPHLKKKSIRTPICEEARLLITMRYLATGMHMPSVGLAFRNGTTTVCRIIHETCEFLRCVLQPIYLREPTAEKWLQISVEFWETWQFPLCLGSIDGKHVVTIAPHHSCSLNYNYLKYFSIVPVAVSDARYNFTLVDIGQYGSLGDRTIFGNSDMGQRITTRSLDTTVSANLPGLETLMSYSFIGDQAFSLKNSMMRPYARKTMRSLNVKEAVFNYRLSRAHRVIENSFGILMSRWRIFQRPIIFKDKLAERVTKACVCLHNYLNNTGNKGRVPYRTTLSLDKDVEAGTLPGEWRKYTNEGLASITRIGSNNATKAAIQQHDTLAEYFVSEIGSVPWQYKHALRGATNIQDLLRQENITLSPSAHIYLIQRVNHYKDKDLIIKSLLPIFIDVQVFFYQVEFSYG